MGWVVQIYNTAESLPNLINPFFMLPIVGDPEDSRARSGGVALLYFMVNSVVVLFLMWFFARFLPYIAPVFLVPARRASRRPPRKHKKKPGNFSPGSIPQHYAAGSTRARYPRAGGRHCLFALLLIRSLANLAEHGVRTLDAIIALEFIGIGRLDEMRPVIRHATWRAECNRPAKQLRYAAD